MDFVIRPIRPEDESLIIDFHGRLSPDTVYQRYFTKIGYEQRIAHERLVRVCFTDYDREIALVAERLDPEPPSSSSPPWRPHPPAWLQTPSSRSIVSDDYQGLGLGRDGQAPQGRGAPGSELVAEVLTCNSGMVRICNELGFAIHDEDGGDTLRASCAWAAEDLGCRGLSRPGPRAPPDWPDGNGRPAHARPAGCDGGKAPGHEVEVVEDHLADLVERGRMPPARWAERTMP
jgi:hypothetical protein